MTAPPSPAAGPGALPDGASPDPHLGLVAGGAAIALLSSVTRTSLAYLFNVFVARAIGGSLFGLYAIGLSIANVGDRTALLGLDHTLLRYGAILHGEKSWQSLRTLLRRASGAVGLAGLIAGGTLFLAAGRLSTEVFHQPGLRIVLRLFALSLPFSSLMALWVFSIQSLKAMHYVALVRDLLRPAMQILLAGILLAWGWGLRGVLVAYLIPVITGALVALWLLNRLVSAESGRSRTQGNAGAEKSGGRKSPGDVGLAAVAAFALPMYLLSLVSAGMTRTGTVLLGALGVAGQAGVYFAAFRTVSLGLLVPEGFNAIFSPVIADLYNRGELEQLARLYRVVTQWQLTLSLPLFLGMALLAPRIMSLFGPDFAVGAGSLALFCGAFALHSAAGSVSPMLEMTGHPTLNLANVLLSFGVNIALTVYLIPRYGIFGAAMATSGAIIFLALLRVFEVYRIVGLQPYALSQMKALLAGAVAGAALYLTTHVWSGPLALVGGAAAFAITYGGVLLAAGLTAEDRVMLRVVRERLALLVRDSHGP